MLWSKDQIIDKQIKFFIRYFYIPYIIYYYELSDWSKYNWFWHGVESEFPLCCVFFFMNVWGEFDRDVKDSWSSDRDGYIPCPDCLVRLMEKNNG